MNLTFRAQCYLAAWDAGTPIDGGMAHGERLRSFTLDYSWASLGRIDAFLDELRSAVKPAYRAFLAERPNVNLLYLLAFYVGEVRSRRTGVPSEWMGWDDLIAADPANKAFGEGFHSSTVQVQPSCFLPLISIVTRLIEGPAETSVLSSSAMAMEHCPDLSGGNADLPLPALPPFSLVADAGAAFSALRAQRRAAYVAPAWPDWFKDDALDRWRGQVPGLLERGRVVWAAVIQTNTGLFDGSVTGAPLDVLYDPRGQVSPQNLWEMAQRLFKIKGQRAADPSLQQYAEHLKNGTTRRFNWSPPPEWLPYPLTATTTYIDTGWLPGDRLVFSVIPILVSDDCPGSVVVAPWEIWPAEDYVRWAKASTDNPEAIKDHCGSAPQFPVPSAQQADDGERLYREGLACWHAAVRDEAGAIDKWRMAGSLSHYLALCALSAALTDRAVRIGGVDAPDPSLVEAAAEARFWADAIAEYRLGFVAAAKLHLRPDRPDARRGDEQTAALLQLALRLGDKHALQMLKVLARMEAAA